MAVRHWWFIGCVLCAANGFAQNDNLAISEQDRESIEARLESIAANIVQLREQRGRQNDQLNQLFAGFSALEQEISDIRQLLAGNRAELLVSNQVLDQLQQQDQINAAALVKQQQQLATQLTAAYRVGRQSRLKLMLNLESAADLTRMLAYHQRFSQQRAVLVESIQQDLQQLAALRDDIVQQQTQIESLNAQYQMDVDVLTEQQRQRQLLVAEIEAELSDINTEIAELQLNQEELETLLASLQDLFADIPEDMVEQPFAELRGQLAWPVLIDQPKLSAKYGQARATGVDWSGVFIDVDEGQPIYAVAGGRVAFADWLRGFGWMIIVDHTDGYMSLYGNNSQLSQAVGSWVQTGEQLAVSGSGFGADFGSGLYFELRRDGQAYNPVPWLVSR